MAQEKRGRDYLLCESPHLESRSQDIWEALEKAGSEQVHPLLAMVDICHPTPLKLPVSASNLNIFSAVRHDHLASISLLT
ncbi:MAG: hypothetical protein KTR25_18475 [Myxococcales bacterium]|nr:hypothetical protein [Myxococcales bacterium]